MVKHNDQVDNLDAMKTVDKDDIIEATVGKPNICQVRVPNTCLKCGKICKSKQGLSVHLNKCLNTSKDGTSFLRNEKYELNLQMRKATYPQDITKVLLTTFKLAK